nr:MAG TPA: hypothetical protein [Caudoviricetes sp.]
MGEFHNSYLFAAKVKKHLLICNRILLEIARFQ